MNIHEKFQNYLNNGDIVSLEKAYDSLNEIDHALVVVKIMLLIFRSEVNAGLKYTIFDYSVDIDTLLRHFTITKLLLRRIEFNLPMQYQDEFYEYVTNTGISDCYIMYIVYNNIFFKKTVCEGIAEIMFTHNDKRGNLYLDLSKNLEDDLI